MPDLALAATQRARERDFLPLLNRPNLYKITLPEVRAVSASEFSFDVLVAAYNQARMDYIVPMPMNAARLREYVYKYDVDLRASVVAVAEGRPLGLAMLGHRERRTWITRLGVIPTRRRDGTGQMLMEHLIAASRALDARVIILEVIQNNVPAHRMFRKLGFNETRELLIIRRPPGLPEVTVPPYTVEHLDADAATQLLARRSSLPSWLDETPSLVNAGNLGALRVTLDAGGWGWIVYRKTTFQLQALVIQTEAGSPDDVGRALLHALHTRHPALDTKSENLPAQDVHWPALRAMGYIEAFRRIEMHRAL